LCQSFYKFLFIMKMSLLLGIGMTFGDMNYNPALFRFLKST